MQARHNCPAGFIFVTMFTKNNSTVESSHVIPAKAGIQVFEAIPYSGFRRGDGVGHQVFLKLRDVEINNLPI